MSLFNELKRRNVFRVGIAYAIVAWLLLQVADVMIENIGAPEWVFKALLLALGIGFVVVLIFSWVFELTPEGLKRDHEVDRSQSITHLTGRKLDRAIIIVLVLAVAYFIWESRYSERAVPTALPVQANILETAESTRPSPEAAQEPSIAVLPFADMSAEGDQGYFSDGISEELLNLLVRVEGLAVASRTSSFAFKGSQLGLGEIARELGVDHILEGSVRKANDQVRITAQLIDAKTDRHLWSDTFDRRLDDIFAIQDEIANAIVHALQTELGLLQGAGQITVKADTGNLDAYELYLEGRQLFIARDQLPRSMELLEQAVALDPAFARAWETLGAVYSVATSWGIQDRDYMTLSNQAARHAIEFNDKLSMAWAVLGSNAANNAGDFVTAMDHFDRSLTNDPKNTTALLWRGISWSTAGFFEKAIDDSQSCLGLDPLYENCRRHLARHMLLAGDNDRALELFTISAERGFFGSNEAFAYELVKRGNRLAAALGIWQWQKGDLTYPAEVFLDALEFPERDHSEGLARFLAWAASRNIEPSDRPNEVVALGGFQYAASAGFSNTWIWEENMAGFRKSEYFKPLVKELGLDRYWRERGFPPICQPLADEDFECDPDAYRARRVR